jgi:Tol biopolymer transport system component
MKTSCLSISFLGLSLIVVVALTGCRHMAPSSSLAYSSPGIPVSGGLVYRNTGSLWIMGDDGESRMLVHHEAALPSPDLKQAVHYDGTHDKTTLWIIDLETHEQRQVATDRVIVCLFDWMDGDTLLLSTTDRSEAFEGAYHFGHLTALDTRTGEVRVLDSEDLCSSLPAVSPDGERIAYSTFRGARLYEWPGGPQVFDMTPFRQLSQIDDLTLTSPAWSPDGQRLAWIVLGRFGATDDVQGAVLILDTYAHTAEMLHPFVPLGYGGLVAAPVWSPDGRWLALVAITHEGVGAGTWLIAADGGQEFLVSESVMTDPFWTAKGQLVWNEAGVWLLDLGTRTRDNILPPGHGYAVGWAKR